MKIFIDRTFSWKEVALLKVCLISFGLLLMIYFGEILAGLVYLWWILFVLPAIYFIYRFLTGK